MAERISMNTSLTSELAEFVKVLVSSGRYKSDSEVVRQGLRLLQEHEIGSTKLKAKIAKGVKQADEGKFISGEKVLAKLKKRSLSKKRKAK